MKSIREFARNGCHERLGDIGGDDDERFETRMRKHCNNERHHTYIDTHNHCSSCRFVTNL